MKEPTAIAPPSKVMLDMLIIQLDNAISVTPAPEYVKKACQDFIDALKKWGNENA